MGVVVELLLGVGGVAGGFVGPWCWMGECHTSQCSACLSCWEGACGKAGSVSSGCLDVWWQWCGGGALRAGGQVGFAWSWSHRQQTQ